LKAGFHEQECIEVVQRLGYACTPIEIVPQMMPVPNGPVRPIWFWPEQLTGDPEEWNWQRFNQHLKNSKGVITGTVKCTGVHSVLGHAVAWNEIVYDVRKGGLLYSIIMADYYGFTPRTYWKIQEVVNG